MVEVGDGLAWFPLEMTLIRQKTQKEPAYRAYERLVLIVMGLDPMGDCDQTLFLISAVRKVYASRGY